MKLVTTRNGTVCPTCWWQKLLSVISCFLKKISSPHFAFSVNCLVQVCEVGCLFITASVSMDTAVWCSHLVTCALLLTIIVFWGNMLWSPASVSSAAQQRLLLFLRPIETPYRRYTDLNNFTMKRKMKWKVNAGVLGHFFCPMKAWIGPGTVWANEVNFFYKTCPRAVSNPRPSTQSTERYC